MRFSNKVYDILVWLTQVVLPAIATLHFTLAEIWGWNYANAIVATITAVVTFMGVILRISSAQYKSDARHAEIEQ